MRFLLLVATASLAWGQPSTIPERMHAVESGLTPSTVLKGGLVQRFTLDERMKALHVRGVSIAVIQNYEVEWAKGYGFADLETKRPVTTDTLFQAGSISKPVAAVAAMKLVEMGKLRLDDPVNTFLKTWKLSDNDLTKEEKVTLRRIMSHSAGLTVHGFPGYAAGEHVPSLVEVLDGKKPANTDADSGRHLARHPIPVFGRRLHHHAVSHDRRDRPDLSGTHAGNGVEQSGDESQHLRTASAGGAHEPGRIGLPRGRRSWCRESITPIRRWQPPDCGRQLRTWRALRSRYRNRAKDDRIRYLSKQRSRRCCASRRSRMDWASGWSRWTGPPASATAAPTKAFRRCSPQPRMGRGS